MNHFAFDQPAMFWLLAGVLPLAALMLRSRRSGLTPRGRVWYTALRLLVCLLAIVALARPVWRWEQSTAPEFGVVVLRDVSASMSSAAPARDAAVAALQSALPREAKVKRLDFANSAAPPGSVVDDTRTNLEAALDVVFADTAAAPATPVIVVSDGRETDGVAERAARRFAARGGAVHAIPAGVANTAPPQVLGIQPSAGARIGVPVRFGITVEATTQEEVEVLLRDAAGQVLDRCQSTIASERAVVLSATPRRSGPNLFTVELRRARSGAVCDTLPALVVVSGPPRCLLVDAFPEETEEFRRAIAPLNLDVELCAPGGMPGSLSGYAAVNRAGDTSTPV